MNNKNNMNNKPLDINEIAKQVTEAVIKEVNKTEATNVCEKKVERKEIPAVNLDSMLSFQRPVNVDFVNEKSRDGIFDEREVNDVKVSVRADGSMKICDGQHTIAILKKRGYTMIPCELRYGLTETEEYNWFITMSKKTQPQDKKRILTAQMHGAYDTNKLEQDFNYLINQIGYKLDLYNEEGNKYNKIKCVSSLFNKYKEYVTKGKAENFYHNMETLKKCFPDQAEALQWNFINGMFKTIEVYKDDMDLNRFVKKMQALTAADVKHTVENDRSDYTIVDKYVKVFIKAYNYNLKKDKTLKWSKIEDM